MVKIDAGGDIWAFLYAFGVLWDVIKTFFVSSPHSVPMGPHLGTLDTHGMVAFKTTTERSKTVF